MTCAKVNLIFENECQSSVVSDFIQLDFHRFKEVKSHRKLELPWSLHETHEMSFDTDNKMRSTHLQGSNRISLTVIRRP